MILFTLLCAILQVSSFQIKRFTLDSDVVLNQSLVKSVHVNWKRSDGSFKAFKFRLPGAVAISDFKNLQDWPVLSIDYGTKFIGLSFHYGGESRCLEGITHDGDVQLTCRRIQGIINTLYSKFPILGRILVLIGVPIAHERLTDGSLLFQILYNLDLAIKLSKLLKAQDKLQYSGTVSHLLTNPCLLCNLGASKISADSTIIGKEPMCSRPGNKSCPEIYEIVNSLIPSSLVAVATEDFSSYQTDGPGRRDSLASCNIFENFKHIKGSRIAILPSDQSIFASHKKEDTLPVYKGLCRIISKRLSE
ncbi:signal peptide containing protein [Theileria equi strain WA]|uniref:Signal peptide containing protein n=1 Tax=Theileria equi strain WA TaxID=1537102 RepID=L1LDU5_THEEQ|nr:signal peptide containing protein [Theileria equi strain WA]EKX73526.1 signal peptide containing protein [Theileria equi strain WA]|eukprot:XP_004832978.1 signal peptide containing protein [Theileria equi strain WA]